MVRFTARASFALGSFIQYTLKAMLSSSLFPVRVSWSNVSHVTGIAGKILVTFAGRGLKSVLPDYVITALPVFMFLSSSPKADTTSAQSNLCRELGARHVKACPLHFSMESISTARRTWQ